MATSATAIAPQQATARLRIRAGEPGTSAPIVGYIEAGEEFGPLAVRQGEAVSGNANWYELADARFAWAGASKAAPNDLMFAAPDSMKVNRRIDNNRVAVLSDAQRRKVFGTFKWREVQAGAITIDPPWPKDNIVTMTCRPSILNGRSLQVHKKAVASFEAVFAKIVKAGLSHLLVNTAGTYVPRHMSWNPIKPLSSHSWGIAIDVNEKWNRQGSMPAAIGAQGSVRELVPIFESEGFAWGGFFQPLALTDGMHFELARLDL